MDLTYEYHKFDNAEDAYNRALQVITPEYLAKWKVNADIDQDEEELVLTATGKGFTLSLEFADTECYVSLKLSFVLKPLRGKILSEVEKKLTKEL